MPNFAYTMPLADCQPRFMRYTADGWDVPFADAHALYLKVPAPPLTQFRNYLLNFPGAPDYLRDTSRFAPSGTGIADLTLTGSVGPRAGEPPVHFNIIEGMVCFHGDTELAV